MKAMTWLDTEDRYGIVSRVLHWGMAGLFLWQFVGMALRLALGRTPLVGFWVGTHQPLGALLLLLAVLRLLWGTANRRRPAYEHGWLGMLAKAGHVALYGLMIVIPSLGLLRAYGSGKGFSPFGLQLLPATGQQVDWMIAPANQFHGVLAWLLLALIAGHAAAAIFHHFVLRDGTLARMTPIQGRQTKAVAR